MQKFCIYILFLILVLSAFADEEMAQYSYATASSEGRYFFIMKSDPNNNWVTEKGSGIYEVKNDGTFKEIWRTEGWYSFKTFLSSDGLCLVRLGNWPRGRAPSNKHLAIAFYKEGRLIKSYSTSDLIKDLSKVHPSVSHYQYLDNSYKPVLEDYSTKFHIVTIDGLLYEFDITTGKINEAKAYEK
ncbi:MAG: hypothetical protein A2Y12_00290 [Planctomycetes bacterium GWF2_42_9]|nr:MAG: hypothetical protein A2Y12_00290 [Planctomycetes bacterium GWF2_42_9]HAL44875.1 hypothetical protein [Phycisphaerales bacterium]